ncbi:MAG: hypothetical protein NTW87_19625, partial [Planctomycetota bacterium]|nr:hypothetical protein [Planctomycetota bacterium]
MTDLMQRTADELKLKRTQVEGAIALLDAGYSVPFVARYRKDRTGGLDDAKIRALRARWEQLNELEKRRAIVLKAVTDAGKITPELQAKIENTTNRTELEDLYMPFRARRRLRSTAAKQKGLEGLSDLIWKQLSPDAAAQQPAAEKPADSGSTGVPPASGEQKAEGAPQPPVAEKPADSGSTGVPPVPGEQKAEGAPQPPVAEKPADSGSTGVPPASGEQKAEGAPQPPVAEKPADSGSTGVPPVPGELKVEAAPLPTAAEKPADSGSTGVPPVPGEQKAEGAPQPPVAEKPADSGSTGVPPVPG